ncbi:MAG: M28 family peptidase [Cytophagaceae bacterium]
MRRLFLAICLSYSFLGFSQIKKDSIALKYANTITASDLSRHLHVLASDSLEGRETGKKGQKLAAKYLKDQFIKLGLEPGNGNSYFQEFNLIQREWDEVSLKVGKKNKIFLTDFYGYGDLKVPQEEKVEAVFAGYGINASRYSDYKNLDVKGKTVIIMNGEPVRDGKSLVTGSSALSEWANDWRKKASEARKLGARHVFFIVGNTDTEFESRLNQLKHHLQQPFLGFDHKQRAGSAFFVSGSLAAEMLKTSRKELYEQKNKIAELGESYKSPFSSAKIKLKAKLKEKTINTENVLAVIPGTDKKDEVIVLTAHYDHLGIEDGKIFYGADDDGSGTAALIEIAEAFAMARKQGFAPRRTILIMPVTAEEKGLMGSEYYTDYPVFPLKNTVANLNVDMIGRLDEAHEDNENYVYIIGSNRLSSQLHEVSENVNKTYTGLELDYRFNSTDDPNRFYYRSDHYNFAKNRIPVIFYFSGVHKDYHQPTDTVDKILFNKASKITQLIFLTAWELANREERIVVDVTE